MPGIEHNIGIYFCSNGHPEHALPMWERSLCTLKNLGRAHDQPATLEEIAIYYLVHRDDPYEAEKYILSALQLSASTTSTTIQGRLYRVLGQVEQHRQRLDHAKRWYEVAFQLFRTLQAQQEIADTELLMQALPCSK